MKLGIIIQARMSSERLPGKVLTEVAGKPLLGYLLERVKRCSTVKEIIVATSENSDDDPIADYVRKQGFHNYRGSLDNVASRFRDACEHYQLDAFVRLSADSPLIDPAIIDRGVKQYIDGAWDLVTNVQQRTFPKGESVEIVRTQAFQQALPRMIRPEHLEHVTAYFYEQPTDFKILNFSADGNFGDMRFVVDTLSDLAAFEGVVERMQKPQWEYGWKDLLQLYKETSQWLRTPLG